MRLADFDFVLPDEAIAKEPVRPRDHSKLLILNKKDGQIQHKKFFEIIDYLRAGDVLVMNNSKVIPARLLGQKKNSGGRVEVLLNKKITDKSWQCLLGGGRPKVGLELVFSNNLEASVVSDNEDGTWMIEFNQSGLDFLKSLDKIGHIPLPPYIEKQRHLADGSKEYNDKLDYQTVYADKQRAGSVAASTAGFHFTKELLDKLKKKGVELEFLTLHVGLGTFAPIKSEEVENHKMHSEWVEIEADTIARIRKAKSEQRRVIAVGTTSTRSLEAVLGRDLVETNSGFSGWVNIYIYPGFEFKIIDGLITNFHLPKSSLLILVSALAGRENILNAYNEAVKNDYRFYSYGDAMFVL